MRRLRRPPRRGTPWPIRNRHRNQETRASRSRWKPESADAPADSPPPVSAVESIEAPEVAERRAAAIAANGKRSTSRTPVGCRLRRLY